MFSKKNKYFLRQTYLCLVGNKMQGTIFFLIIFIMSALVSGALFAREAISSTHVALRSQLPAVVVLDHDQESFMLEWQETEEWPTRENMTTTMLGEMGDLPYVRSFNFSVLNLGFYSSDLMRVWDPELFLEQVGFYFEDQNALSSQHDTDLEQFLINGVGRSEIFEFELGLVTLNRGRFFSEQEIEQGLPVVIVSESFLAVNDLNLGDTLVLEYFIGDEHFFNSGLDMALALGKIDIEFEIVGVFDRELPTDRDLWGVDIQEHFGLLNDIFVPATLIEYVTEIEQSLLDDVPERFLEADRLLEAMDFRNMYFLLYDPLFLDDFHVAAAEIFPEHWRLFDYTFAYEDIAYSMALIQEMADWLLIGAIVGMVLILTLLVLLFLKGRKKEMGIYLALGRKRGSILLQMVVEIMIPTILAMTLALFVGQVAASHISTELLWEYVAEVETDVFNVDEMLIPGFRHGLTNEEMLQVFDVTFTPQTVFIFYSVVMGVVFISISGFIVSLLRMNPKDILTTGDV